MYTRTTKISKYNLSGRSLQDFFLYISYKTGYSCEFDFIIVKRAQSKPEAKVIWIEMKTSLSLCQVFCVSTMLVYSFQIDIYIYTDSDYQSSYHFILVFSVAISQLKYKSNLRLQSRGVCDMIGAFVLFLSRYLRVYPWIQI